MIMWFVISTVIKSGACAHIHIINLLRHVDEKHDSQTNSVYKNLNESSNDSQETKRSVREGATIRE